MSTLFQLFNRIFRRDGVKAIEKTFAQADQIVDKLVRSAAQVNATIATNADAVEAARRAYLDVKAEKESQNADLRATRDRAYRFAEKLAEITA